MGVGGTAVFILSNEGADERSKTRPRLDSKLASI